MNNDVFDMIERLHARLEDVRETANEADFDLVGFAQRLDKIDDQIYLLMLDMEKKIANPPKVIPLDPNAETNVPSNPVDATPAQASTEKTTEASGDTKPLISDDMKKNLADAGRALGGVLRDSKDVISELSGTASDLKEALDFKSVLKKK